MVTPIKRKLGSYINYRYTVFKTRKNIRDKKGYYLLTKESILQEDIIILNVYKPNKIINQCEAKLTELKGETNPLLGLETSTTLI